MDAVIASWKVCEWIQFNCCQIFLLTGVAIGRQVYFPLLKKLEKLKDHQFHLRNSMLDGRRSVQGRKGLTPLSSILLLPQQSPYDSMHLVCHGHVKTLLKSWREMFPKELFDNGLTLLSRVVLPHSFKYQFSAMIDFSNWKAKVLRDFFLYVSPMFAIQFLPDDYSTHFLLYYTYVRVLYSFTDRKQLIGIGRIFHLYHESLARLYSPRSELATIHYHSHPLTQVYAHGALYFTSCFPRDSYLAYVLKWSKGNTHVLSQLVTWYEVCENTQHTRSFSLSEIFSTERFSHSYLDNSFIISLHHDFTYCLQAISASTSECEFYCRYYRGLVCFHSISYSRRGHSISHFVSVQALSCLVGDFCFASVLFYFSLHQQNYAFVKIHPCLPRSLGSLLNRPIHPLVKKTIDSYFKLFDESVRSFKILPVSSIARKSIKVPLLENNICSFTCVDFDFEHD